MLFSEYRTFDAIDLAEKVRNGTTSGAELARTARQAIEDLNGKLNAVVEIYPDDDSGVQGPFAGVPFLIKDMMIEREGALAQMGCRLAQGLRASADTELMKRFRMLGLNTIGLTNVPEFGHACTTESVLYGPARNPWNLGRLVGGSSGGAAASVAAGIVPVAHGNDGAGSLRGPSACCGVFSVKPTRGRVTLGPRSSDVLFGMVNEGVISRTVRDSAAFLDGIAGSMPGEPYVIAPAGEPYIDAMQRDPGTLRIAVCWEPWSGAPIDAEVVEAVQATAALCRTLGHEVHVARPDLDFPAYREANIDLFAAGLSNLVDAVASATGRKPSLGNLETATHSAYERGKTLSARDILAVHATFNAVTRSFGQFFERYDIFLSPVTSTPAPKLGTYNQNAPGLTTEQWWDRKGSFVPFLAQFNVTGQPAMSVPLHQSLDGLPIGIQAAAGFGREDRLFQLARQFEEALPWARRTPSFANGD